MGQPEPSPDFRMDAFDRFPIPISRLFDRTGQNAHKKYKTPSLSLRNGVLYSPPFGAAFFSFKWVMSTSGFACYG
jgi:hypothetical protein